MGLGGEKIDNLRELTVKVRTERHGESDISIQGAKVRKPLLAVSEVIDKGNIVVFHGSGSFILPSSCAGLASVRKAIIWVQGRIPLHAKNWNICLADVKTSGHAVDGFQSARSTLKGPSARLSKPGPPVRWLKETGYSW